MEKDATAVARRDIKPGDQRSETKRGRDTARAAAPASWKRVGRPRDSVAHAAILQAANAILEEAGIAGFSVEAVAARAGVGKATIYRWWPSKGALAVAGFLSETAPKIPFSETGSIVHDLVAQLQLVVSVYSGAAGRILAAIVAEGQRDPQTMAAFIVGYAGPRREEARHLLQKGIERGELRRDLDLEIALDVLYGSIYYRLLVPIGPMTEPWIESLVHEVLHGFVGADPPCR